MKSFHVRRLEAVGVGKVIRIVDAATIVRRSATLIVEPRGT